MSGEEKAMKLALEGHNFLMVGTAGSGKTYLVNKLAESLIKLGKHVQITCSTGIACSNYLKRTITDPSKARIRYVAGYCVAKVKNHYFKQKTTNAYKDDGFNSYQSAKHSLSVIRQLTEDENDLKQNSKHQDSLTDISRRQHMD